MRTAAGDRAVPLNPTAFTGLPLTKSEAAALRGSPELVRGYNREGLVVAIRVGGQQGLWSSAKDLETVWVTHFATCPRRAAFRKVQQRRRELRERRQKPKGGAA